MKALRWPVLLVMALMVLGGEAFAALDGYIGLKNGYFYDKTTGKSWVPHGIAYQTWNRPLGVWQTFDQIDYDLDEMVKMGANSIRVDFVWQHIEETGDNVWKWTNYDYLVQAAEKRGLRIFALIGYQWPPNWFPDAWYTQHPPAFDSEGIYHPTRWQSDIINYEHPQARAQYAQWFQAVCARYKNSKAIVAWIIGNESGYLGLWSGLLDGYDPESEQSFRNWCQAKYGTIAAANAVWGTSYASFAAIKFVEEYREYGQEGRQWVDMVQWREDSIATFTAIGAKAAKAADTNHLISYSTVGMQWGEENWRYHAEDREKITKACLATNAAIDFFSVNNYPWSVLGHESQNGHWGISFTKKAAGVPVLYSETGFTSSETMWPGMNEFRQGPLIRNALWESLAAGAIGTHIFAWHDRPYITDREKGFGILTAERGIKPAFWTSRNVFSLMEQAQIHDVLMGSKDPKPDVAFLWTAANDSQYNRYECEMQQIAGAMERLGFAPYFINLADLAAGAYTNYKAIVLPLNARVDSVVPGTGKGVLKFLRENVLPKGVHVLASADFPGQQDEYGRVRADFTNELALLFGVNGQDASGYEVAPRTGNYISSNMVPVKVVFTNALGALTNGYTCTPRVWKYKDEARLAAGGVQWAWMDVQRNKGFEDSNTSVPGWYTWGTMSVASNWGWQYEGKNMLRLWGDAGIWQDFQVAPGGVYAANAYLRSNSDDALRNGKQAYVSIEWYDASMSNRLGVVESARLSAATPGNAWVQYRVEGAAPSNAVYARRIVRIAGAGDGSVYVDGNSKTPAVVVKNHTTAKAAIFLFSAGDISPDGNSDGEMDVLPWKWRYDYFGAVLKNYFGVQPAVQVTGANAYLCLADYRTLTNGATLWQVKNYMYDRFHANGVGGPSQTFTLQSGLFNGKTIRAFEQGRVLTTNSNGAISLTLPPDGQEILLVYNSGTNRAEVIQIADAPSIVHPTGDKVAQLTIQYDGRGATGLRLKTAFKEASNNGDAVANEMYALATNIVAGAGQTNVYLWIPDYNAKDTDYKSTPDGGQYVFVAWLETSAGVKLTEAKPFPTRLEWGVRPVSAIPTNLAKGSTTTLPVEWEGLYEPLFWQNTPLARNDSFPTRVGLIRSSKTEAQFPGHFAKANAAANWLQSLGYQAGNPLALQFDDVVVSGGLYSNNFSAGTLAGWTRDAGCANWTVSGGTLRADRIGNSDNILAAGTATWSNYTVSAKMLYTKQDNYFNDAELYFRYQDRANYYKVGIRNSYGFWRLKYTVMYRTNIVSQGWLTDFPKTNSPKENVWYTLKVESTGSVHKVYFNNKLAGSFTASQFPRGKIAVGTRAQQLGNWEPQKGYYFIDDDEWSFWAPEGQPQTSGKPMNLDWNYLQLFYSTLVLPGVQVMSDIEVNNIKMWATNGLHSLIVTDGGAAMRKETGASGLGRMESLLGVGPSLRTMSGLQRVVLGSEDHYVRLDYGPNAVITATGTATAYSALTTGKGLGVLYSPSNNAPAFICNVLTNNPAVPVKVFCFNYAAESLNQLAGPAKTIAQRAFEWARGNAYKCRIELKYSVNPSNPSQDFTVFATNVWMLGGSGTNNLSIKLPSDGIMTGTNLYWAMYAYPWDASDPWASHGGFYSSMNDGLRVRIPGKGLQVLGGPLSANGGRAWDLWLAYNTDGQALTLTYGLKDKGRLQDESNFNAGNYTGWNIVAHPNIRWSVTNGALRASVLSTGGYSTIYRNGLGIGVTNITLEYKTRFMNGAKHGGAVYRGRVLYVNPLMCGWADNAPNYVTAGTGVTTGRWHHVVVNVRDGSPYLRSDLFVDGKAIFLDEPIESTSYTTNTVGLLSPYSPGFVEWDNVRVADEQYGFTTQTVTGVYYPTNNATPFYPFVPDYDPLMWEHDGTALGAGYEWYAYFQGEGVHAAQNTEIAFVPRLRVEVSTFPTVLVSGATISVPVDWEKLPKVPAKLGLKLVDPYSGLTYVDRTSLVTTATGSMNFSVTLPTLPAGSNYLWSVYAFATNAAQPWNERYGADDTFRFDRYGQAVEPETTIKVNPVVDPNVYRVYSDAGTPAGSSVFVWSANNAGQFNGAYTGETPPEGLQSFRTVHTDWAGWGIFASTAVADMRAYSNGYLKFSIKVTTSRTMKIELQGPSGTARSVNITPTANTWQAYSIPISSFGGINLQQVYGLFSVTSPGSLATTYLVDDVRWSKTP